MHYDWAHAVVVAEKPRWTPAEKKRVREDNAYLEGIYANGPGTEKSLRAAMKATEANYVRACSYCRTPQADPGEGRELRTCKECAKIGRKVFYCSK